EDRGARRRRAARAVPDRPFRLAESDLAAGLRGRPGDLGDRRRAVAMIVKPHVDWFALAAILSLLAATGVLLMVAVFTRRGVRRVVSAFVGFSGFVTAIVFAIVLFERSPNGTTIVHDAMFRDRWSALAEILIGCSGAITVLLSYRERWRDEHVAEYYA